jgi:alkanesulfonate monooxygenase SsuD/methylene tetrahydromethanopterin reductase-like flavin-dependent oxidoreductase (luciferase family)
VINENGIRFACYIYQQGLEYTDIRRIVLECEKLGFDSVWFKDNFTSWLNTYFSNKEDEEPNSEDRRTCRNKIQLLFAEFVS